MRQKLLDYPQENSAHRSSKTFASGDQEDSFAAGAPDVASLCHALVDEPQQNYVAIGVDARLRLFQRFKFDPVSTCAFCHFHE